MKVGMVGILAGASETRELPKRQEQRQEVERW